ncbi:F204A protein, partial [Nothocercus nigrocapillus]|nr:F204A protein [Nothocercus nigrocapillus]
MWSGLLPPGLNESDIDLSSDDEDALDSAISCSAEDTKEDIKTVQLSGFRESEAESSTIGKPPLITVTDGEDNSQTCPPGVSLSLWNKFLELQKRKREMKTQPNQGNRGQKRKRRRKVKSKFVIIIFVLVSFFCSQQLANEEHWKELTQYFGINDRFETPMNSRTPQKSGLELSIEKSVAEGDIDKAEELSDRLALRELGVKIAKAAACRNFVKAKQEAEAAQEARRKKKLAWG